MTEIELPAWLAWLGVTAAALAGLIGSVRIIYKFAIKPVVEGITELREKFDALNRLAERELMHDGGFSMKDQLTSVTKDVATAKQTAEDVIAKQAMFETYVHERMHDFANALTIVTGKLEAAEKERLRRRLMEEGERS